MIYKKIVIEDLYIKPSAVHSFRAENDSSLPRDIYGKIYLVDGEMVDYRKLILVSSICRMDEVNGCVTYSHTSCLVVNNDECINFIPYQSHLSSYAIPNIGTLIHNKLNIKDDNFTEIIARDDEYVIFSPKQKIFVGMVPSYANSINITTIEFFNKYFGNVDDLTFSRSLRKSDKKIYYPKEDIILIDSSTAKASTKEDIDFQYSFFDSFGGIKIIKYANKSKLYIHMEDRLIAKDKLIYMNLDRNRPLKEFLTPDSFLYKTSRYYIYLMTDEFIIYFQNFEYKLFFIENIDLLTNHLGFNILEEYNLALIEQYDNI